MFRRLAERLKERKSREIKKNDKYNDKDNDLKDVDLNIKRKAFDYSTFINNYPIDKFEGFGILATLSEFYEKNLRPNKRCSKSTLYKRVPAFKWLQEYRIKEYLLADILSGLTVRNII